SELSSHSNPHALQLFTSDFKSRHPVGQQVVPPAHAIVPVSVEQSQTPFTHRSATCAPARLQLARHAPQWARLSSKLKVQDLSVCRGGLGVPTMHPWSPCGKNMAELLYVGASKTSSGTPSQSSS